MAWDPTRSRPSGSGASSYTTTTTPVVLDERAARQAAALRGHTDSTSERAARQAAAMRTSGSGAATTTSYRGAPSYAASQTTYAPTVPREVAAAMTVTNFPVAVSTPVAIPAPVNPAVITIYSQPSVPVAIGYAILQQQVQVDYIIHERKILVASDGKQWDISSYYDNARHWNPGDNIVIVHKDGRFLITGPAVRVVSSSSSSSAKTSSSAPIVVLRAPPTSSAPTVVRGAPPASSGEQFYALPKERFY